MTVAILCGAGSGALHAVTGPDHVLSLGPVALERPKASFRIGLLWGAGHALGTLVLSLPLLVLSAVVHLPTFASIGERLAGAALLAAAVWSWRSRRQPHAETTQARQPFAIGLVHGVSGAGSLLLVLPVLVAGSLAHTLSFLVAFALGSTLAMAALTALIAKLGGRLERRALARAQTAMMLATVALGVYWLVA